MQPVPPLQLAKDILKDAMLSNCQTRAALALTARHRLKGTPYAFPTSLQFWTAYRELMDEGFKPHEGIEHVLRIKDVRTDSGVAPLTVLTKPFPCPGHCIYCPSETRMPKSYISSEPAAARALSLQFDPYEQVQQRVRMLEKNGHQANKIELIVKGGTWSFYPQDYREWFVMRCFEAANDLVDGNPSESPFIEGAKKTSEASLDKERKGEILEQAQKTNEIADYRIIGLTIETRPDWVTPEEVIHLRKLGVTRVELGLQIINDRVLELVQRGATVDDAARAIALLKTAGFKVDVHMMPGLPSATAADDLESFRLLFSDPRFRPDMVKIYPCVVMPKSELAAWTERGEFKPLEGDALKELLIEMQTMVPRYSRVPRMIRDFPNQDIAYGNKQSNLREIIESEMKRRGLACVCLRCREVGHVPGDHMGDKTAVFVEEYENAGGTEVFLSVENEDRSAVFGFCRLRLPKPKISLNLPLSRKISEKTEYPYIPYDQILVLKAREYRNRPTIAEQRMWNKLLRNDKMGYRFLRQKPLDHFIVDFYCAELMLAIEIDGPSHDSTKEQDHERTARLETYGIKVIRYTNQEIINKIEDVHDDLREKLTSRKTDLSDRPSNKRSPSIKGDERGIYDVFPVLRDAAIIRELHTYGTALDIDQRDPRAAQHKGYGRWLMSRAEQIAADRGYAKMAVISGLGVREYYRLLGYAEQDTYMAKALPLI